MIPVPLLLKIAPYAAVAVVAAGLTGYITRGIYTGKIARIELAHQKFKTDAETLRADAEARNREIELANAEYVRNLDATYNERMARDDAGHDDFVHALNLRVRNAEARARRCDVVPRETPDPSGTTRASAGGELGLGGVDTERLAEVRRGAMKLSAVVKLCYDWAREVGR